MTLTLVLLLVVLWAITHRYRGLTGDAELYALQALSRLHTNLSTDLYLQNVSQDHFTLFSPLYALCINWLGLQNAALTLTIIVSVWFLSTAWALARTLFNSDAAFLAVASLIIIVGEYGGYGVFRYAEDWLTARSVAEALIVTSLLFHFQGATRFALLIATAAMAVHPLMALPGLLLLICLRLPLRVNVIGSVAGLLITLGIACTALAAPTSAHFFTPLDASWLQVVRERSQFLFLQLWTISDWKTNARPFLSLALTALVFEDPKIPKLATTAILVGFTGLGVALLASLIGPVAILIQGQAWRWVWITAFVSVLLLAPTALRAWRNSKCGPLCAMLLIVGWTFTVTDGTACVALALVLWVIKARINDRSSVYLRWAAAALGLIVVAWTLATTWNLALAPSPESGRDTLAISRFRNIAGLGVSSLMVTVALYYWVKHTRLIVFLALTSGILAASAVLILPGTFKKIGKEGTVAEKKEFAEWRQVIAPMDTVYVVPMHNSATFAWFTLERPSYSSIDQSAGVVFSRATALEIKRRSQVLEPLVDPDWKVLSRIDKGSTEPLRRPVRPLNEERLVKICIDPLLDFVIAREAVGFRPLRHIQTGDWNNWNLYDCRFVRALRPVA